MIYKFGTLLLFLAILFIASCQAEKGDNSNVSGLEDLRIISTAPSITEIIHFLDCSGNLVGVTDYCKFPGSVDTLPKIGALLNPNLEQIIALDPDLLIYLPAGKQELMGLENFNINMIGVRNETIEDILESIRLIGNAVGKPGAADSLIQMLLPFSYSKNNLEPISIMIIVNRRPGTLKEIYVSGRETYLSQLVEAAGFRNVYSDLPAHYASVGIESIIAKNPVVILDTKMTNRDSTYWQREYTDWKVLKGISAVQSGNIFLVSSSFTHLPAVRAFKLSILFAEIRKEAKHD